MATNWKRRAVYAGALLAVGVLGGGCMESEEESSASMKERREAQLRAQPFQSYGDGTLPQEIKPAAPQGTGGSGGAGAQGAPEGSGSGGSGSMVGQPVQQQPGQGAGPAWKLPAGSSGTQSPAASSQDAAKGSSQGSTSGTSTDQRPRRDSGSSEKN